MPYYTKGSEKILYIHVPKTGGSSIEKYLVKEGYNQTHRTIQRNTVIPDVKYNNISMQHQTYQTLYKHRKVLNIDFENASMIATIRNPYDRIISELKWRRMINPNSKPKDVFYALKKYLSSDNTYDNHKIPQYMFLINEDGKLNKDIKIFRCENLTSELNSHGFTKYSGKNKSVNYDNYLNNDSIELINSYYKKDFEFFGYHIKTDEDERTDMTIRSTANNIKRSEKEYIINKNQSMNSVIKKSNIDVSLNTSENQIKCKRCNYVKNPNPDIGNNEYCCNKCMVNGNHGPFCKRIVYSKKK